MQPMEGSEATKMEEEWSQPLLISLMGGRLSSEKMSRQNKIRCISLPVISHMRGGGGGLWAHREGAQGEKLPKGHEVQGDTQKNEKVEFAHWRSKGSMLKAGRPARTKAQRHPAAGTVGKTWRYGNNSSWPEARVWGQRRSWSLMKGEAYQEYPWAESRFLNFVTIDIWQDNSAGKWGGGVELPCGL